MKTSAVRENVQLKKSLIRGEKSKSFSQTEPFRRTSQATLFEYAGQKSQEKEMKRTVHGGESAKGRRKTKRPLARNKPHHLILKASRAKGAWSFLAPKNRLLVVAILKAQSKKFGVKIADFANVGNHLHLTVKFSHAESFKNFLRSTPCLIARKITGAKRGNKVGKFWDHLAFTRIIKTRFEEWGLKVYVKANRIEAAEGQVARKSFLASLKSSREKRKLALWVRAAGLDPSLILK